MTFSKIAQKPKKFINRFTATISPERFFVYMAVFFGLVFIAITPPFQAPDEPAHYLRAYQVSQFNFTADNVEGTIGGKLPASLGKTIDDTMTNPDIAFHANYKYDVHKTAKALEENEASPLKVYNFSATAAYGPIAYMPQAIGIGIARLVNLPPIAMMYFGRLCNLVFWIVLMALAIRLLPYKKWVMVFIGLLPMALSQASSLSSDAISLGLTGVFIGAVFYFAQSKARLNRSQLLILLGLAIALCLTKQLTFLALPVVLLLPGRLFAGKVRNVATKAILILIPLTVVACWMWASGSSSSVSDVAANGQNASDQLKYILLHPHSYINTLWNTYFFSWGDSVTRSMIGVFGWADAPLSELLVTAGYLSLAALYLLGYGKFQPWLTRNQKVIVAALAVVYALAISTALYLFYSPVGFKIVYGLQGRYFLPILMLLIPLLYTRFATTTEEIYRRIAIYAPVFLLLASTITIFVRYYVNNV